MSHLICSISIHDPSYSSITINSSVHEFHSTTILNCFSSISHSTTIPIILSTTIHNDLLSNSVTLHTPIVTITIFQITAHASSFYSSTL